MGMCGGVIARLDRGAACIRYTRYICWHGGPIPCHPWTLWSSHLHLTCTVCSAALRIWCSLCCAAYPPCFGSPGVTKHTLISLAAGSFGVHFVRGVVRIFLLIGIGTQNDGDEKTSGVNAFVTDSVCHGDIFVASGIKGLVNGTSVRLGDSVGPVPYGAFPYGGSTALLLC